MTDGEFRALCRERVPLMYRYMFGGTIGNGLSDAEKARLDEIDRLIDEYDTALMKPILDAYEARVEQMEHLADKVSEEVAKIADTYGGQRRRLTRGGAAR